LGNNHSPADPRQAISTSLDAETIQTLKEFSDQCNWEGKNPCLDKTYKDNTLAQTRFECASSGARPKGDAGLSFPFSAKGKP
jgi:hypothetical protein